ncbi:HEAT repeat domain-containing protein [Candidatus Peregrinibacteria bacterium]|nr:HEAT repeat domain-containing protein [Candidatus Peregrinibacteria bacterium]
MNIFKKNNKNLVGYIAGVGILLALFVFFITCTQIGHEVEKRCEMAQSRYGGECVDALINQIAEASPLAGKNDAIWALGQLGDKKALPFLEQYDTGKPLPEREPWNEGISQYELRKAIKLLKGGLNLSAFVWRD